MKKLISLAIEYQDLNSRFGYLSSLQFPSEYNRMDELRKLMKQECERLTANNDISTNGLYTVAENLASDILNGDILEDATFTLYSLDQFINLLSQSMTTKEAERFIDMLDWMQERDAAEYIQTRFILEYENTPNHDKTYYYDKYLTFVIVVK